MGRPGRVEPLDHVAVATKYARDVVAGRIPACKLTKQACQRQLTDLEEGPGRGLRFNRTLANRACNFVELMPHVEGRWATAGEKIRLQPWQCFLITTVFGWQRPLFDGDGAPVLDQHGAQRWVRRFKRAYTEVARKNGKSALTSALGQYVTFCEREEGAQGYSAATTRDQAKVVSGIAWKMARKEPEFRERWGVAAIGSAEHNPRLIQTETNSSFTALSSDHDSLDGLNPHFVSVDELHAHKTRELWEVLDSALGARDQPLLWAITTAGSNETGICYEVREYVRMILEGLISDDAFFGVIYTIDEFDEQHKPLDSWQDERCWPKANPNLSVMNVQEMRDLARKAESSPAAAANFKTKRLNVWVSVAQSWANMEDWKACADASLDLEAMRGLSCFIGLDLASKVDIAAVELLFPWTRSDGKRVYRVFHRYYLPEARVKEKAAGIFAHYASWAEQGQLILTPGQMIDFDRIQADIERDLGLYDVAEIDHDPWQAAQMIGRLTAGGALCVEIQPNVKNFSEPMKSAEGFAKERLFQIQPNPAFFWMVSNVTGKEDYKDNVYPRKESGPKKIDAFVALLSALGADILRGVPEKSIYDERLEAGEPVLQIL